MANGFGTPEELERERKRIDEEMQLAELQKAERKKEAADHEEVSPRSESQISDVDTRMRPPAIESPESIRRRAAIANPLPAPTVCEVTSFDREGNASLNYRPLIAGGGNAMPSTRRNKLFPQRIGLPAVWTAAERLSSNYCWGKLTTPSKEVLRNMHHASTKGKKETFFTTNTPSAKLRWPPKRIWDKITADHTGWTPWEDFLRMRG